MIRSSQALLVSLSLHLLTGVAVLLFVVPRIVSSEAASATRYRMALSHVVPVLPALDGVREKALKKPQETPKARPEKVQRKEVKPPVKPKPVPVKKTVPAPVPEAVRPAPPEKAEAVKPPEPVPEAVTLQTEAAPQAEVPSTAAMPSAPTVSEATRAGAVQSSANYLNEHLAVIARLLRENLYYPKMARKRQIEGEVLAAFTLRTDGTIQQVIVKKHASAVLDRAAIRTIESLSGRMPHPNNPLRLEVPIRFVLK